MNIIKRSGQEVIFDPNKIYTAISKAVNQSDDYDQMSEEEIHAMTKEIELKCQQIPRTVNVEEVSDYIEKALMDTKHFQIAKLFITYRYTRALARKANTTDDGIMALLERNNEEAKQENSNKNPIENSVQRDYMAGEVSRDITRRILLPEDISQADRDGIIHFHDSDYFAQHMYNCCLVNLLGAKIRERALLFPLLSPY